MDPRSRLKVLIVENRRAEASAIGPVFARLFGDGIDLVHAESLPDAVNCMEEAKFAVVMIDPLLCDRSALDTFLRLRRKEPSISLLMVNDLGNEESGITTVLQDAGDHMSIAIPKTRLQEVTEKSLQRVHALYEVNTAIASTLDVQKILNISSRSLNASFPSSPPPRCDY